MITLTGTHGKDCKIFTDNIEPSALDTIQKLLDHPVTEGQRVRIMPDVHDGVGITIGFTMPMGELVNPQHVGVDIGCGMLCIEVESPINPDRYPVIDRTIREVIPMGFHIHEESHDKLSFAGRMRLREICNRVGADRDQVFRSIGTLGGGNHFIELGRSEQTGKHYLTIHSGSRNLGKRVCDFHAKSPEPYKLALRTEVECIKRELPKQEWNEAICEVKKSLQFHQGYLSGMPKTCYMVDMETAQNYASVNRHTIAELIFSALGWKPGATIETPHNYIDIREGIIRKGAVRALEGELLVIPMNMADGILLCRGKGNSDWNWSAPHGAGRLYSRTAARQQLSMDDFRQRMADVYSSSICPETLDESPMAYKPADEIIRLIEPTVEVEDIIKPAINIKALR